MVFIVIDGLDASGKTTQAMELSEIFRKRGHSVCLRFHPSDDNLLGAETKKFLYSKGKNAHFAAATFYMLDVLRSILLYSWRKYDYLIFVRYLMGTAYLPYPLFIIAYDFFSTIVPRPDFMFFLDVAPEEAHRRIRQTRKRREMFENPEKLKLTRQKALFLTSRGKWTIINADKSIEEVENEVLKSLSYVARDLSK